MNKIIDKDNNVYGVYGAKTYQIEKHDYDYSWKEQKIDFLIYDNGKWNWVDSKYYKPFDE